MNKLYISIFLTFFAFFTIGKNSAIDTDFYDSYDVLFYKLDLHVDTSGIFLKGYATVILKVLYPTLDSIFLELVNGYVVDSVLVDGIKSEFTHISDKLSVYVKGNIGQIITTQIFYQGNASVGFTETGVYNRSIMGQSYTFTLTEPFSAKYVFPCKQDLKDKADSVYVFITTDKNLKAGANGLLENTVLLPGNKVRYEWKSRYPIDYYLISFAVGDYLEYNFYTKLPGTEDSVFVQNYIYNDSLYLESNRSNIERTSDFLVLFSQLFGNYPFISEKYGHCTVPIGGGMEHQTMTTLNGFSFILVSHELAHQWFGDNVTCATWQDIWINEGFASYGEYLAIENISSKEEAVQWMTDAHNFIMSEEGGSVYVPDEFIEDEDRIFEHRLSYKKGAAIIHTIRQETGNDSLFFDILKEFQNRYKDSVATGEDFKNVLETNTGKDFDGFFRQWYYGEGYPKFKFSWSHKNDTLKIISVQQTSESSQTYFDVLLEFKLDFINDRDSTIKFRQNSNYLEFEAVVPGVIKSLAFDPQKWLIAKVESFVNSTDSINGNDIFYLAPNPVSDKLRILFKIDPGRYKIYISDLTGKLIKVYEGTERNYQLDLSFLSSGNYFLTVENNKVLHTKKIVKK